MGAMTTNEKLVVCALDLVERIDGGPVHGYRLARLIAGVEPPLRSMNYATVYRILSRLEARGLLVGSVDPDEVRPGRPRRCFRLTDEIRVAIECPPLTVRDGTLAVERRSSAGR